MAEQNDVIQPENNEKKVGGITGKGFVKGDPRINRKGRPRNFDALRKLGKSIANEQAGNMTRVEMILRDWSLSKKPELQKQFMEICYGKVPTEITGADGGAIKHVIEVEYVRDSKV